RRPPRGPLRGARGGIRRRRAVGPARAAPQLPARARTLDDRGAPVGGGRTWDHRACAGGRTDLEGRAVRVPRRARHHRDTELAELVADTPHVRGDWRADGLELR